MMFGKSVHDTLTLPSTIRLSGGGQRVATHPSHDDRAIEHLLTTSRALQPCSAEVEHDDQYRRVSDESRAHDVVSSTLAEVAIPTVSERCCHAKQHLCAHQRVHI